MNYKNMPVSNVKGDFCNINGFKPSARTVDAIAEMNEVIKMASWLEKIMMVVPLFEIFANKGMSVPKAARNITKFDWEQFAQATKGISDVRRKQLETIAMKTAHRSTGKEYEFWTCVYNAL
ncbi:conserved hypothetical protein [Vibrio nigripulchritudo SFn27]|nr:MULTISPECIES: hypothetical protein [Vibrio]CCN81601.1 conserved hypothetical protein [Vibrio nigripulchritudo BLFn1]UAB72481.1 hypothetical protein INR79_24815 [Vibrio sp. SCSIO 43132]CCN72772.1 conserved hypothetical protein [Vibrio nigripulchritudo SFn118]CCN91698.1 conserved hypothetical protein [Vibrio nigripulchritudo SFn27]CCN96582.1 conserved hypothetical protein [Vibrio nigripulchritudo ENn2]